MSSSDKSATNPKVVGSKASPGVRTMWDRVALVLVLIRSFPFCSKDTRRVGSFLRSVKPIAPHFSYTVCEDGRCAVVRSVREQREYGPPYRLMMATCVPVRRVSGTDDVGGTPRFLCLWCVQLYIG